MKRFRKPLIVGVLVVVALAAAVVVCDQVPPADPPLRVGMTADEVVELYGLGSGGWTISGGTLTFQDVDWRGNNQLIWVEFEDNHVVRWRIISMSRTSPPWLDRALKAVGW